MDAQWRTRWGVPPRAAAARRARSDRRNKRTPPRAAYLLGARQACRAHRAVPRRVRPSAWRAQCADSSASPTRRRGAAPASLHKRGTPAHERRTSDSGAVAPSPERQERTDTLGELDVEGERLCVGLSEAARYALEHQSVFLRTREESGLEGTRDWSWVNAGCGTGVYFPL
eukprot:5876708-Prymnesium_polylepis.1